MINNLLSLRSVSPTRCPTVADTRGRDRGPRARALGLAAGGVHPSCPIWPDRVSAGAPRLLCRARVKRSRRRSIGCASCCHWWWQGRPVQCATILSHGGISLSEVRQGRDGAEGLLRPPHAAGV